MLQKQDRIEKEKENNIYSCIICIFVAKNRHKRVVDERFLEKLQKHSEILRKMQLDVMLDLSKIRT